MVINFIKLDGTGHCSVHDVFRTEVSRNQIGTVFEVVLDNINVAFRDEK